MLPVTPPRVFYDRAIFRFNRNAKVVIDSMDQVLAAAKMPARAPFLTQERVQIQGAQFYLGGPGTGSPLHYHGFALVP